MASPPPNPSTQGAETSGSECAPQAEGRPAQKPYVAPTASQVPTKTQYVVVGAPGPSGIKQIFRTVKMARRVPTLPTRRCTEDTEETSEASTSSRRSRRDRSKRHACATCDKRFSSPGKLNQHELTHTGELPFSCEFCDKKFNSKFKLVRHNLIHSEAKAFACTVCGKTFNRKDHLSNHVRVHNPVKKLFTCNKPNCRKSYTSLLSYRKHAALHSAEEGNLQCIICDEKFATKQEIFYHLKVHTGSKTIRNEMDKKFTCDHCDRKFFTAKDVRRHLVVHTGRRDFLCPHCPQKFGRKDHLVRHVKNAHPEESWRSAAVGTSSDPPLELPPEETSVALTFNIESSSFELWKPDSPKEDIIPGRTRVPSSDIIVEIPSETEIKIEPIETNQSDPVDIKLEPPTSPCELLPIDFPEVFTGFTQDPGELPYIVEPIDESLDHITIDPRSLLLDPGEGPSGLSSHILRDILENRLEDTQYPQRLPAFQQAFQGAQGPKQPPKPPAPH